MEINIRPGRREDAKLLGWCMLMAGRSHLEVGIWDYVISQPEDRCLQFLEKLVLEEPRHMCHYGDFLVAEVDGRPAGALVGFDPLKNGEETITIAMANVVQKMGLTEQDMAPGVENLAAFMTCHSDFLPDVWVIGQVATRPEFRRMGVLNKLLEGILDQGRKQGLRQAQVSFYVGNVPGERAYQKAGFRYVDEKRHPDFEKLMGSPGMIRYARDL